MALIVGEYDASTFVEGAFETYPQLPPGAVYYQPVMGWLVTVGGVVQGQTVVAGDLLFATQGGGRLYGDGTYGSQIFGGLSDGDWTVDQVFFLAWDSTLPPPDQPPYPNAGCPYTRADQAFGDWAPGWRIVIDAYYDDRVGSRIYGEGSYGSEVFGSSETPLGGPRWVDLTQPSYRIETGDGMADGSARVTVAEVVVSILDETGFWFDIAEPATWHQPQPGTALRVGFIDPVFRYHPVITAEIERIEDVHDGEHPRAVEVRGFGRIMDLVVDAANVQRPSEFASTRFNALVALAGWRWGTSTVEFPLGDNFLLADDAPRDITVRDELDRTVQSVGWSLDSDRHGRMRLRTWPHEPTGVPLHVVDCRQSYIPPTLLEPAYLTPTVGTVSTPDTPNLTIGGDVRLTAKVRLVRGEITAPTFCVLAAQSGQFSNLYRTAPGGGAQSMWRIDEWASTGTQSSRVLIGAEIDALLPDAEDVYIGWIVNQPIITTPRTRMRGLTSTDGATWNPIGAGYIAPGVLTWPDAAAPLALGNGWRGRIYWVQMEAVNRAQLVFPGVAGNYASVPDAANLDVQDMEIVARLTVPTPSANTIPTLINKWGLVGNQRSYRLDLSLASAGSVSMQLWTSPDGATAANRDTGLFTPLTRTFWVRVSRIAATGAMTAGWAADQSEIPTAWTSLSTGTDVAGAVRAGTANVLVGQLDNGTLSLAATVHRLIIRDGVGGTTVLDVDERNAHADNPASFVATTGQTVTVTTTAGKQIVTPIPDAVIWRFDADDYPGDGTTYTDPRGRTWTLTAAAAITPAVWDPGQPGDPPNAHVSHAIVFVNDESQLLNHIVFTNTKSPDADQVVLTDEFSRARFGKRGRALGFPATGLAWSLIDATTAIARRVLNRFSFITRHVESLDADTSVDQGWLPALAGLDTGRAIRVQRHEIAPLDLDGVVVGWRHRIEPGRWTSTVFISTTTTSM